jgi:hypothetical protein
MRGPRVARAYGREAYLPGWLRLASAVHPHNERRSNNAPAQLTGWLCLAGRRAHGGEERGNDAPL